MKIWLLTLLLTVVFATNCNETIFLNHAFVEAVYDDGTIIVTETNENGIAYVPDGAKAIYVNKILAPPQIEGLVRFRSCFLCLPSIRG